jgi:hypothetical protein
MELTKERPISFSTRWVNAILERRKSQTRRVSELTHQNLPNHRYGRAGDRFWVKETYRPVIDGVLTVYLAGSPPDIPGPWKPSRFMPRWASRIDLRITQTRIESLQSITDEDIAAEGIQEADIYARRLFWAQAWDEINRQPGRTWDDNPAVWVINFNVERIGDERF